MGPLGVAIPLPRRAARKRFAQIAQLVEQGTENPRVAGSIPALGISFRKREEVTYNFIWGISSVGRALDF